MITDFVTRDPATGNLMVGGRRFRFAGANTPFLGTVNPGDSKYGAPKFPDGFHHPSHPEIDATLAEATAMKATVLQSYAPTMANIAESEQPTLGVYNDAALEPLDYLLSRCNTLGIRIVLGFGGAYSGSQLGWSVDPGSKFWYCQANGVTPDAGATQFFTDPRIVETFTAFIRWALTHVNPYTGVAYRDDPTILAWQVVSEVSTYPVNSGIPNAAWWPPSCVRWMDSIADHIKNVCGARQLVVDGHCTVFMDDNTTPNVAALSSPNIDIFQVHPYGKIDPQKLIDSGQIAHSYGKAFMVGEWPWNGQNVAWPYFYNVLGYDKICPLVERSAGIDGDLYWQLLAPGHNWGGRVSNYTLHYPGETTRMQRAIPVLTAHAERMASN